MNKDIIYRHAAIDAIKTWGLLDGLSEGQAIEILADEEKLPSVQPEITDEQAIEHLQSTGWMQNHDKQMYEMGLKEKLADDSGSYDSLIPSAQPEQIARDIATIIENEQDMRVILQNAERTETHSCENQHTETHDLVSRQLAIKTFHDEIVRRRIDEDTNDDGTLDEFDTEAILRRLPSVQPESRREWYMKGYRDAQDAAMHESCTDCPLYDHDRHNCPRFNRVIPATIEEVKPRWIPCEDCEKRCEKWENSKT